MSHMHYYHKNVYNNVSTFIKDVIMCRICVIKELVHGKNYCIIHFIPTRTAANIVTKRKYNHQHMTPVKCNV